MADIVYLVRHAAPPEDKMAQLWGRADPGVDPDSVRSAATLPELMWEKPARLFVSPLERARLTADRLNATLDLRPECLADLAEADFGKFDGLSFAEVIARYPNQAREWKERPDKFVFPEGESMAGFLARADRVWRHCIGQPDKTVAVVAHGGIIAAWVHLFLQLAWRPRFAFRPAYSALTAFIRKKDGSGWEMTFFNNTK